VTFTSAASRTDVPTGSSQDLACATGATCAVVSPTFWSKYQLTTIATSTLEGTAQTAVDSWALTHEYLSTGATSAAPLWLEDIARTGEDGSTHITLPSAAFGGTPMDNRTMTAANLQDGYSMIPRNRITSVQSETGGVTTVTYDTPPSSCTSGSFPADDANTLLCYPTYWTPPGASSPREDWFNKYVVSAITQANTAGGTTQVVTNYSYSGAAWHYDDDTLTRSSQRTWDEWRGFAQVTTETGNAADSDPVTETADTYLQGMNGDYQNGNPTISASVTSQVGGVTVPDSDQFAGVDFEHIVYDGAGGAIVTSTVTTPWTSAATATQSQPSPLPALTAYLTGTAETQTYTALASDGYREADVTYTHDSYGRVTSAASAPDAADNGSGGDPGEDTCSQTTYDSATSTATAPSAGNLTEVQKATAFSGTSEAFTTESKDTYDEYGRVLTALNANSIANSGNPTTTAYTPATGAEPTSVKVTDPMGLATTTTYDPARDLPRTVTNPASLVTTETYDALGRLTAVWTPGHSTSGAADKTFSYTVSSTAPSVITTNTINTTGGYLASETLYDSLGRQIETQAGTPDGGRDITDIYYNSDGWPQIESSAYYTTGAPSGTLVAAPDDQVPSQTGYVYDGAGRVIRQIDYSLATEKWETDTSYGGDYTTVTPPAGGTAETTYVNGAGKTSYIYQYHSATPPASPPAPGAGSQSGAAGWDQTAYTYTPAEQLTTITDDNGNTWTYGYDLAGDQTTASDPDAGNTTSTYDGDGNLLSVTQAGLNTTTSYTYDADDRKTAEYDTTNGAASASDEVASWTWDTLDPGMLTSSTAYAGGTSGTKYTESVSGYNAYGLPQGSATQISAGAGAGTYRESFGYTTYADEEANVTYEEAGGLPQEEVSVGYNAADEPISLGSSLWTYVATLTYTELGQPQEYALGTSTEPAWILARAAGSHSHRQRSNRHTPNPRPGRETACRERGTDYGGHMPGTAVRAFLGSQGLGALPRWTEELPRRPRRAVVVPTAGNPLPSAPWAAEAAEHLAACGVQARYLDLEGARPADVDGAMGCCELVFVTGGHPIFLLEHAQRSGFTRIAGQAVLRGEIAYAGMSAGACLATADLAFYRGPDDPGSVETTQGLGLVGFFPLVHANRGRQERYARLIAAHGDRCEFVPVNDDQAVTVVGETWQRQDSAATPPHSHPHPRS